MTTSKFCGICGRLAIFIAAVAAGTSLSGSESESAHPNDAIKTGRPYPESSGPLVWDTLRGHFHLSFTLDPPAATWSTVKRMYPKLAGGEYKNGAYRLAIGEKQTGNQARVISYELTRTDGRPFPPDRGSH